MSGGDVKGRGFAYSRIKLYNIASNYIFIEGNKMFKSILKYSTMALLAMSMVACAHHDDDNNYGRKKQVNANCHRGMGGGVFCSSH